jgi:hypothetical protein
MNEHNQINRDPEPMEKSATAARLAYTDHDLLIRIDTKLEIMGKEFDGFKTQTSGDLQRLWQEKVSRNDFNAYQVDHQRTDNEMKESDASRELRLKQVEKKVWTYGGGVAALNVMLAVVLHFWI